MESVELCARLARFVRADGATSVDATTRRELRSALDATVSFYEAKSSALTSVDDVLLVTLQRLLLSTVRELDFETQARALAAVTLLISQAQSRLGSARVVDLLQTCSLYLPVPAAAVDPTTSAAVESSPKPPEELKLAALRSIEALLSIEIARAAVSQLTQSLDTTHFLAYIVSSLLQLAERERNRNISELSLEVLKLMMQSVLEPRVLRMFFPGITVGMWKIVSAPLRGTKVTAAAINCLTLAISGCLGETEQLLKTLSPSQHAIEELRNLKSPSTVIALNSATNQDDQSWESTAVDKVETLISLILSPKTIDRYSWRVHRALVDLCRVVTIDCRRSLEVSFFRCFEELMVLRTHAISEVADSASDALSCLKTTFPLQDWVALEPRFAERFQLQLSTLVVQCGTEHEMINSHIIDVLNGYVQFQQHQMRHYLDETMPSIIKTLRDVFAFDGYDVELLRHESAQVQSIAPSTNPIPPLPYFRKRFSHFQEESTIECALRLLRNIGLFATPAVIVDTAFDIFTSSGDLDPSRRDAVLVILIECLRSRLGTSTQDNIHLVGRILDDLFLLPLWNSTVELEAANTTALVVECVGVCVELVGPAFDVFLLYALYPLVEKLGDPVKPVELAALSTLRKVSLMCGYGGDLQALFGSNMDYLVDVLCSQLEELDRYPRSPHVVEALLRYASVASLPLVNEIARSLLRGVDLHQHDSRIATTLLRSLQLLIDSFTDGNEMESTQTRLEDPTVKMPSALKQFVLEVQATIDPVCDEFDGGNSENGEAEMSPKSAMPVEYSNEHDAEVPQGFEDDTETPPLPFQAQTVAVLERCSYFLSDEDPVVCCLVLATIEKGVRYLRPRQRELLPLVHRLWPSILHRLTVSNRPILTATMQLLGGIAECVGDFIGDRFVETAWPSIRAILESIQLSSERRHLPSITKTMLMISVGEPKKSVRQSESTATVSPNSPVARPGRTSLDIKLLEATLTCLRAVCDRAVSVMPLVPEMTRTCAPFLNPTFPSTTIVLTQDLLLALGVLNGDEVFLQMARVSLWKAPEPPSSVFPQYKINGPSDGGNQTQHADFTTFNREGRDSAARVIEKLLSREKERM